MSSAMKAKEVRKVLQENEDNSLIQLDRELEAHNGAHHEKLGWGGAKSQAYAKEE